MPSPDTEPDNYSIDEMMERLRSRSDSGKGENEPELVTRADGSQMYRVRKRKRRSHQPKKEEEKRKGRRQVVQVVIGGAVVGLIGLTFVGSLVFLNSSAFRSKLTRNMEEWTGAKVETTEVRFTPISVAAKSVSFTWPEGSALGNLKAFDLKGDVDAMSYLSGPLKGTEISSRNGSLQLLAPSDSAPQSPAPSGDIPFLFRYRSPHFNITAGQPEAPAFQINETEASLSVVDKSGTKANLQMEGGTLTLASWGAYNLDFASLQIESGVPRLGTARFTVPGSDHSMIELIDETSSPIQLKEGGLNTYRCKITHVPMSSLVGKGLSEILIGEVDSTVSDDSKVGSLSFRYGAKNQLTLDVPFHANVSNPMRADRLPMFAILAERTRNDELRKPKFELDARGSVHRDGSGVKIEDLHLETRGFISISGFIAADSFGNLSGTLSVGIQPSLAMDAGSAVQAVFSREQKSMVWTDVHLSGTVDRPQDDLLAQIDGSSAAAPRGASSINPGTPAAQPGGKDDAEWDKLLNKDGSDKR